MPELTFELNLSAAKVMAYYRGELRAVQARATTGQLVQFPASALQRLITTDGVHGRFKLVFDDNRKFVGLERVPDPPDGTAPPP